MRSRLSLSFLLLMLFTGLTSFSAAQRSSGQTATNNVASSGACSPNVVNPGSPVVITCIGFSDKQNAELISFLKRLSSKESSDQSEIISRLNALLDLVGKSTQRAISQERIDILSRSPWGVCYPSEVIITAPKSNTEAQAFASQLSRLLLALNYRPRPIKYDALSTTGDRLDLKVVESEWAGCLGKWLVPQLAADGFKIRYDYWTNPVDKSRSRGLGFAADQAVPIQIYVYGK